jgi:hypothetical protein
MPIVGADEVIVNSTISAPQGRQYRPCDARWRLGSDMAILALAQLPQRGTAADIADLLPFNCAKNAAA